MSFRVRLAAAFTLLVGALLVLSGVITYQLLRHSLLQGIQQDVVRHAQTISESGAPPYLDTVAEPDVFMEVVRPDGSIAARSANLGTRNLPVPADARPGHAVEVRLDGRPLVESVAPTANGGRVVVARSPLSTYHALGTLRNLLMVVTASAMLLTALTSWWYARATLRPIRRVVRAAAAVRDSRDLGQRVVHRGPSDELGRLVATFNAMLSELDKAYQALDRSNERMRQFLADCSHELRAPLSRVRSAMDLLNWLGDDEPELRSRTITDVTTETDRMAAMVRQLLLLARADAGASIQRRPVRLDEVMSTVGQRTDRMGNGVVLVPPDPGEAAGVVIDGDADHLEQMVLILIDNAVKYTPPPGRVRFDARADHDDALITVQDTGMGIPPEDLPRIFDRFYRGRNASTAAGTGLGLAIARWIADQHGGRIDVTSRPGQGSTFTVRLPQRRAGAEQTPTGAPA